MLTAYPSIICLPIYLLIYPAVVVVTVYDCIMLLWVCLYMSIKYIVIIIHVDDITLLHLRRLFSPSLSFIFIICCFFLFILFLFRCFLCIYIITFTCNIISSIII